GIPDRNVTGVQTCALPISLLGRSGVVRPSLHWFAPTCKHGQAVLAKASLCSATCYFRDTVPSRPGRQWSGRLCARPRRGGSAREPVAARGWTSVIGATSVYFS